MATIPNTYAGMQIITNALMTETVKVKKSSFDKFLDLCLQWNPCDPRGRTPDTQEVPSQQILSFHGKLICHPSMMGVIRQQVYNPE